MQTKIDYLHLLLVSKSAGLTTKEAPQFFQVYVSRDAAGNILRRLYKQRCAWRKKKMSSGKEKPVTLIGHYW